MKFLIERFWHEPAVAISVVTALGNAGGIILVAAMDGHLDGAAVALALGAIGLTGAGGIAIRSQVVPMNKDREMGEPPPVVKVDEVVVT